jgi:hypothetical protein
MEPHGDRNEREVRIGWTQQREHTPTRPIQTLTIHNRHQQRRWKRFRSHHWL